MFSSLLQLSLIRGRRPVLLCAALAAHGAVEAASVETLLSYDFDSPVGFRNAARLSHTGLTAPAWILANGTLGSAAGNPGMALSATGWASGNAYILRVELASDFTYRLDGFRFDERASNTGARDWRLSIAGVEVASGASSTSFATRAGALDLGVLSGHFDIVLQGLNATSNSGTWRLDNFILEGEVISLNSTATAPVPVPPALALLLGPVLGLGLVRRRQA